MTQVQDAFDLIDIALEHGHQRVGTAGYTTQYRFVIIFKINAVDLISRHHDVVHGDLFKIEDIDQHVAVSARYKTARLVNNGAELFLCQRILARCISFESEQ